MLLELMETMFRLTILQIPNWASSSVLDIRQHPSVQYWFEGHDWVYQECQLVIQHILHSS